MPIMIGPSTYSQGGTLRFGYYQPSNGDTLLRLAMWVTSLEGEVEYRATVNIPEVKLPSGFVHIKDWDSNEGVPEALVAAGVIRLTDRVTPSDHVLVRVAELTDVAMAELDAQSPDRPPLTALSK